MDQTGVDNRTGRDLIGEKAKNPHSRSAKPLLTYTLEVRLLYLRRGVGRGAERVFGGCHATGIEPEKGGSLDHN